MLKIQQLIKTLNNTEAHRKSTKDSYLRMSKGVDMGNFFPYMERNHFYLFKRKNNLSEFPIRVEKCHDGIRIYNIGKMSNSRADDLWGGDKIILEKRIDESGEHYFIDCKREEKSIFFQNFKNKGFDLLTPQKIHLVKQCSNIKIISLGKELERKDSPDITEYFDILVNEERVLPNLRKTELLKLEVFEKKCIFSKTKSWEFYQYQFEV